MPPLSKIRLSPSVEIPTLEFASQGNAVLGIRGSGKTYSATWLAEQLFEQGIPFIAFDPIGVWRCLKLPGAGRGYPVVVAHPSTGDVPLTPESAPELVRAAMKSNVSLVIDLYAMQLSKADWRRIVESCMKVLLFENGEHGLRHIFIEEAAEFAPQRIQPDQGKVYATIESLARMGGNAQLGYTLINQRAEEVNKAVLELCDTLFLHRQKGRNSLTALSKWLDLGAKTETKKIIEGIAAAGTGEAYVWTRSSEKPLHVRMPRKNSFHPDREARSVRLGVEAVDVSEFVRSLNATLSEKAKVDADEANELKQLRKENEALEAENAHLKTNSDLPEAEVVRVPVFVNGEIAKLERCKREMEETIATMQAVLSDMQSALAAADRISNAAVVNTDFSAPMKPTPLKNGEKLLLQIGTGAEALLKTAAAHHPVLLSTSQLGTLAGYTPSTVRTYLPKLAGLMEHGAAGWKVTDEGWRKIGADKPKPKTKAQVQEAWLAGLSEGPRKILRTLIDAGGRSVSDETLQRVTGYTSSTIRTYLPILRRNRLIDERELRVSPDLI